MPPLFGKEIVTGPQILQFLEEVSEAKLCGITCLGKEDGGGAQGLAAMSVQLFCKLTKQEYYHSPLRRIRFAEGRSDWDEQWENFFNLGFGEKKCPQDVRVLGVAQWLKEGRPQDVILALPHCHNYIQNIYSPNAYCSLTDEFRKKYWSSGKEKYDALIKDKDYLVLHIRRGDVSDTDNSGRFTSASDIIRLTNKFIEEIGTPREIHVFSQGKQADFEFLNELGDVKFFLNLDIFETIHRMVNAKALIAAKSAVSYTAGILGQCPVMTELWYHQPLDDWYRLSTTGHVLPHRFLNNLKNVEIKIVDLLSHRTDEADAEIVEIVEGDPRLLMASTKLQWFYAQALLRQRKQQAYPILIELSKTDTPQAAAAMKTLNAHQKMGTFFWPTTDS